MVLAPALPGCPHGALIPKEITDRVAENPQNQGVNAAVWCLSPNMKEYLRVWGAVEEPEIADLVFRRFPGLRCN